jgi:hypothetical protein
MTREKVLQVPAVIYGCTLTVGDLIKPSASDFAAKCESYSGLVPRRYCKETLPRVQRVIELRGL